MSLCRPIRLLISCGVLRKRNTEAQGIEQFESNTFSFGSETGHRNQMVSRNFIDPAIA